jgi:hypothetical protein
VAEYALDLARADKAPAALPDPPVDEAPDLGERAGLYGPITVGTEGIHASGRDGDLRKSADDVYTTDHPDLCVAFVRFGRSTGGRVDHLMWGDDWYAGQGYAGSDEFPLPASTARTTRGFRRSASRCAGGSWPWSSRATGACRSSRIPRADSP